MRYALNRQAHQHWPESLANTLKEGVVDYVPEYSPDGRYALHHLVASGHVKIVTVTEDRDLNWVYVACPKTRWGKQVIADINQALRKVRGSTKYREYSEFLVPEHLLDFFRQQYQERFLTTFD